jgi:type II secretory pathway pseudopilin PulG
LKTQRGASLLEIVIVVALLGLMVMAGLAFTTDIIGREKMLGAAYSLQSYMHMTRMVAVQRHHSCQFVLDTSGRRVQVIDLHSVADSSDDEVLEEIRLPDGIAFARPDSLDVITLNHLGSGVYEATIVPDGSVTSGAGYVSIRGGETFTVIRLYAAGAVRVERWVNGSWVVGNG